MLDTVRRISLHRKLAALALASAACLAGPPIDASSKSGLSRPKSGFNRIEADYVVPNVTLIQKSGQPVSLASLADGSRPVVLEFFYTSCTTICGMQASTLGGAQAGLGPNVISITVSIDPEYDTPARLRDYAQNFPVGRNWYMLTGKRSDIAKVLTAFDARPFGDNKMFHRPYVYIRPAKGRQWVRIEGLTSSKQIVAEVRSSIANPPPPVMGVGTMQTAVKSMLGW